MTVGEFAKKYHRNLMSANKCVASDACYSLMGALCIEACNEINMMYIRNLEQAAAIIKRKDAVWRMLATWHPNVIVEDAFKNYWLEQWPELAPYWG